MLGCFEQSKHILSMNRWSCLEWLDFQDVQTWTTQQIIVRKKLSTDYSYSWRQDHVNFLAFFDLVAHQHGLCSYIQFLFCHCTLSWHLKYILSDIKMTYSWIPPFFFLITIFESLTVWHPQRSVIWYQIFRISTIWSFFVFLLPSCTRF